MSIDARTPEEIEHDIEEERAQLASSLEALQERFSIEGITRQVVDQFRQHGGEFGRSALESAKSNPVALALTGIGLAWLMASDSRTNVSHHDEASFHDPAGARASTEDTRNRLYEGTENLSEAARKRVVEAREAAYQVQSQIERTAGSGSRQLVDFYSEQPIVAGAMAFAAGAALGAFLPHTKAEDSALGETSDKLFEEAERVFVEETEKAKEAVRSASSQPDAQGTSV